MSQEAIIGIAILAVLIAAIIYYLHTKAGKAEAATLEAKAKADLDNIKGTITTAAADIKSHVSTTAATTKPLVISNPVPATPTPTPAPTPVPAPPAQPATVVWDNTGKTLAQFQAFVAANPYPTVIVGPNGYLVDVRGDEIPGSYPAQPAPPPAQAIPDSSNPDRAPAVGAWWGYTFGNELPFPRTVQSKPCNLPAGTYTCGVTGNLGGSSSPVTLTSLPGLGNLVGAPFILAEAYTGTVSITGIKMGSVTVQFFNA